jgi:hypothetical protein
VCIGQVHLTAEAREFSRCKLDLVGVQGVRWYKAGTVRAGIIIISMKRGRKSSLGNRIFCTPQNIISI